MRICVKSFGQKILFFHLLLECSKNGILKTTRLHKKNVENKSFSSMCFQFWKHFALNWKHFSAERQHKFRKKRLFNLFCYANGIDK